MSKHNYTCIESIIFGLEKNEKYFKFVDFEVMCAWALQHKKMCLWDLYSLHLVRPFDRPSVSKVFFSYILKSQTLQTHLYIQDNT